MKKDFYIILATTFSLIGRSKILRNGTRRQQIKLEMEILWNSSILTILNRESGLPPRVNRLFRKISPEKIFA